MNLPTVEASSHTSLKSQKWLSENVSRFWDKMMWPPCSPDSNLMDFSVWSLLEKEACSVPHKSIESLKDSLKRAWEKMSQSTLCAICDSVPKRIKLLLKNEGSHFENKVNFFLYLLRVRSKLEKNYFLIKLYI